MKELIERLQSEAGLTEEQAVKSYETIKNYLKSKVPFGMGDKIADFIDGKGGWKEWFDRKDNNEDPIRDKNNFMDKFNDFFKKL